MSNVVFRLRRALGADEKKKKITPLRRSPAGYVDQPASGQQELDQHIEE